VWKPGVIVTAEHTLRRDEEVSITLPDGSAATASLAGRDPDPILRCCAPMSRRFRR
jgi:hypothetical protein